MYFATADAPRFTDVVIVGQPEQTKISGAPYAKEVLNFPPAYNKLLFRKAVRNTKMVSCVSNSLGKYGE